MQARSVEWTTQTTINSDTFWLQSFGTRNTYLIGKCKIYVILPLFLCFSFYLRAMSKYKPPGVYIRRRDLTEGLCATILVGGGHIIIWRGLFSEFYGFTSNGIRIIHIDICCSLQFKFRSHRAKSEKVMTKSQWPCIIDGATSSQDYLTTSVMFFAPL